MSGEEPGQVADRRVSRRALLAGGLGIAAVGGAATAYELVQAGVLPGKYALARLDGACGSAPPLPPGPAPTRREVAFYSAHRRRTVTMVTLTPAGVPAAGLPVVVGLHGTGSDARQLASQLSRAITAARITRFAAVTIDGGDTYWHRRADGDDPIGMIIYEALPRLAAAGHDTARIALEGDSMGGYGALLLAEQLARGRPGVTAVAALSPAIFASYAEAVGANQGSFDSAGDFARHDVVAGVSALRGVPAWISCGNEDPFEAETTRLRTRLAAVTGVKPAGGILPGCHDDAFWARNLPAALTFLAQQILLQKTEEGR
ncbi:MAG TPA: alpha/beta hydrolase-fold protein [Streptosporangiaceae bacterium]|nr:alpha/beta hydrolase-fold protein [Streptosporangiaceae bacterium]